MNFNNIQSLDKDGFKGFKNIGYLFQNDESFPCERGIYLVLTDSKKKPMFINPGSGGFYKGEDPNVEINKLNERWVKDTTVLYIGQAGGIRNNKWSNATLCKRIRDYLAFGRGKNIGHKGGRLIWQIKDYKELIMCWKDYPNKSADPSKKERDLLDEFEIKYQKLPFANLRKG